LVVVILGLNSICGDLKVTYFVGIGAQKSGTTWLANTLAKHPKVFVSHFKEMHFFDRHSPIERIANNADTRYHKRLIKLINNIDSARKLSNNRVIRLMERIKMQDIEHYQAYFETYAKNYDVYGEITPEYATLDVKGFLKIKETYNDAKIIFIMRNPIDRVWSAANHMKNMTGNSSAIDSKEGFFNFLQKDSVQAMTMYHKTIENVNAVFDSALYIYYEDIFYDSKLSEKILRSIFKFIGVDFIPELLNEINNISYKSNSENIPKNYQEIAEKEFNYVKTEVQKLISRIPNHWSI